MKKIWNLILFVMLISETTIAQINLVPNPSFEDTAYCPITLTQINAASGWSSVNIIGTPDYYNTCSTTPGLVPPTTFFTYQYPLTGKAFAGIATIYYPGGNPDPREYIGAQLSSSMQVGTKYFVSFYINRGYAIAQHYVLATNKLGALFSTIAYSVANPAPENNFAHVYTDSIITDTLNWVQVKGSFIADSAYQYINIGNFFDNAHTDTLNFGDTIAYSAYYLIENVCVSADSNLCYQTVGIEAQMNNGVVISYPNPVNDLLTVNLLGNNANQYTSLILRDLLGEVVHSEKIENYIPNLKVNVSPFANGIYLLELKSAKGSLYKKILVSHY